MIANSGLCYMQIRKCKIYFWSCIYKSRDGFFSLQVPAVSQPALCPDWVWTLHHGLVLIRWLRLPWMLPSAPQLPCFCAGGEGMGPQGASSTCSILVIPLTTLWQEQDLSHNTKSGKMLTVKIRWQETLSEAFYSTFLWRLTYSNNTGKHHCLMNLGKAQILCTQKSLRIVPRMHPGTNELSNQFGAKFPRWFS